MGMTEAPGKGSVRLIERPDVSALATDRLAPPDDSRREPTATAPPALPALSAAAEPVRLDPTRVELGPMPKAARRRLLGGPIASVLLHLLPLLAIADWPLPAMELERPIPVKLVILPPAPPPPAPPAEPKPASKPPNGRYASDDFAETVAPEVKPGQSDSSPGQREAPPQAAEKETELVAAPLPPPPPIPLRELASADPFAKPAASRPQSVAHLELPPKPDPPKLPPKGHAPRQRESAWPLPHHQPPPKTVRTALLRGPDAIRDAYCAEALSLTLRHIGLLPRSLIGGRQGATVLAIRVLGDGTIDAIRVAQSSGYPDIDERIERMVLEVGRYPPLPPWMGPSMDFTFQMHFPNQWQH